MGLELTRTITTLPEQLEALADAERARFEEIFAVARSVGETVPPPEMEAWIERSFGSVDAVRSQSVVKTLNRWTLEGSLFNDLRARRPMESKIDMAQAERLARDRRDPFCAPLTATPADTFGRVRGRISLTASNVAKYDALHAVIIFDQHEALMWPEEQVLDAFETAQRWLAEAHEARPQAVYPFIMWNCLPRSGASILHAHMQAALSEGIAYGRVELWRRASLAYRERHGRDYFEDFYDAHRALGLGGEHGALRWMAHLTPMKEKELVLLSPSLSADLHIEIFQLLRLLIDTLGVRAYNVALYLSPVGPVAEDWSGFPVVTRIVDRGDPSSATSDIGAMELFAQPVVASDPFRLAEAVRNS